MLIHVDTISTSIYPIDGQENTKTYPRPNHLHAPSIGSATLCFPCTWAGRARGVPFTRFYKGKHYLVDGIPTPLKNMSSLVRMMTFPIYGKVKNVPNHQPAMRLELEPSHMNK